MYCVKCGVRLQDGVPSCPLCGTPVWNPLQEEKESSPSMYSDRMPLHNNSSTVPQAALITVLFLLAIFAVFVICRELYGRLFWGGIAIASILLFYVIMVLPLWFRHANPVIFVPVDHGAVALYLLYLCLETEGHWFLSFALPITFVFALINTTIAALVKYVGKGKLYLISGVLYALSLTVILIEFLAHVTFGFPMFRWSLYAAAPTFLIGTFFLIAAIVKPLKNAMKKWFFI